MEQQTKTEIEAAVFRRLVEHLDNHKEVQMLCQAVQLQLDLAIQYLDFLDITQATTT